MMKIRTLNDCHLEFGDFDIPETADEKNTIMILPGDIGVVDKPFTIKFFLKDLSERFKYVICVLGNHEYYNGSLLRVPDKFREIIKDLPNVILLDDEVFIHDGVKFIGSTLWTDLDNLNPILIYTMKNEFNGLTDFKIIRTGTKSSPYMRKIDEMDIFSRFLKSKDFIFEQLEMKDNLKHIVITHHAPSYLSISPEFKGNILNGCYVSNLFDEVYDSDALFWFHGHTHKSFDYDINETRIVCNPRGYVGMELNKEFDNMLEFEI